MAVVIAFTRPFYAVLRHSPTRHFGGGERLGPRGETPTFPFPFQYSHCPHCLEGGNTRGFVVIPVVHSATYYSQPHIGAPCGCVFLLISSTHFHAFPSNTLDNLHKMNSFIWLLFLSVSMLGGSFFAGNIPLAFQFSEERLRLISTFGSGMLVGTALIVIIPEGVETLYSVQIKRTKPSETESPYPKAVIDSSADMRTSPAPYVPVNRPPSAGREKSNSWEEREDNADSGVVARVDGNSPPEQSARHNHRPHSKPNKRFVTASHLPRSTHAHSHSSKEMESFEAHRYIGAALAIGFAFMFLVDQAGHFGHSHNSQSHIVTVNDFRDRDNMYPNTKIAATIGLVVHAAADGIALGAATASGSLVQL